MYNGINVTPGISHQAFEVILREQWFQVYSRFFDASKMELSDFLSDIKVEDVAGDEVYSWDLLDNIKKSEVVSDDKLTYSAQYGF